MIRRTLCHFFMVGFFLIKLGVVNSSRAQTIVSSLHNLSATSGTGSVVAAGEPEICVFCHTPHNSKPFSPLWNKNEIGTTYTLYNTSSINASIGQPDGSAILCLSCHDGTIALGEVRSRQTISFAGGITTMPLGKTNLSTNIKDDHPISFPYTSTLAANDGQLKQPTALIPPVKLENGKVQCVSCHDPHDNSNGKFLVSSRQNSTLCLSCHERDYWTNSTHQSSSATWNGAGTNPWNHTPYSTVAENACENCHNPHNAGINQPLLNYDSEETNCLTCHNRNVASTNILAEINKTYSHNVTRYDLIHDVSEPALSTSMHVECFDCHNPHATNSTTANAPDVSGFNQGVKGIDINGNEVKPIQYQYELCFRCHGDSPNKPGAPTLRLFPETNVRLEFNTGNPSYHPVVGPGANSNVPSLISPLTESSIIYCTDCHKSDNVASPAGPHGSIWPQILRNRYSKQDNRRESESLYRLCYNCHSRESILRDESFDEHKRHLENAEAPCNACHDPHGSSGFTHMINFDLNIVSPRNGVILYEDLGNFTGRCTLICHGEVHNARLYPR